MIGSLAQGHGDRWSDLDLTFDAVPLLDLDAGGLVYRVFLLPEWLQVDLSFTRGSARTTGGAFRPVFGPYNLNLLPPPTAGTLFGWAVLYARHARVGIARRQWWHAEYCISSVRDHALALACLRRDLPTGYGKGFDQLPWDVRQSFEGALVRSLTNEELVRALGVAVTGLLHEAGYVHDIAKVEDQLRELTTALE